MRVGGIGGTPFRPFGGIRLSLGAFRQGLTALARRVPFPPNFGGVGFICRYPSPTAVQGFLKAGRKAFGDLVQKWGIRGPISQPFFPFPPTKAGTRLQLPRLADVRPRLPSLPSLRPSLPKGIMDKFNNFINKFRIKPMDVGKIWKDFQAELGRHVGGTGRRPAGDVLAPFFPFPPALARTDLGAFRQKLSDLARRVPLIREFRCGFCVATKATPKILQAGRKAFGDLVRKRGIQPSAQRPTAPSPPLGKRAIGRPSTPTPGARKSIPEETVAKLQKSMDPRKVWDEFQKELSRYLQSPPVSDPQTGEPILLASTQPVSTGSSTQPSMGEQIYGKARDWWKDPVNWLYFTSALKLAHPEGWELGHIITEIRVLQDLQAGDHNAFHIASKAIEVMSKVLPLPFNQIVGTPANLLNIFKGMELQQLNADVLVVAKKIQQYANQNSSRQEIIQKIYEDLTDPNSGAWQIYQGPSPDPPEAQVRFVRALTAYVLASGDEQLTGKPQR